MSKQPRLAFNSCLLSAGSTCPAGWQVLKPASFTVICKDPFLWHKRWQCMSSTRDPGDEPPVYFSHCRTPSCQINVHLQTSHAAWLLDPENPYRVLVVSQDLSSSRLGLPCLVKLGLAIPGNTDTLQRGRVVKTLTSL